MLCHAAPCRAAPRTHAASSHALRTPAAVSSCSQPAPLRQRQPPKHTAALCCMPPRAKTDQCLRCTSVLFSQACKLTEWEGRGWVDCCRSFTLSKQVVAAIPVSTVRSCWSGEANLCQLPPSASAVRSCWAGGECSHIYALHQGGAGGRTTDSIAGWEGSSRLCRLRGLAERQASAKR